MSALAVIGLYDELWSGIAVVAAPGVERAQRLDHAYYALVIFALPLLIAALIEAPLALISDRVPRRYLLSAGLCALAASLAASALTERAWLFSLGLAAAGAASGIACATAQAELISTRPGDTDRALSRWSAFAAAGDILAPLMVGAVLWIGASYATCLTVIAGLTGLHALLVWRLAPSPSAGVEDETGSGASSQIFAAVRAAARQPRLWFFLFAAASCTLLDEIVVALSALRLHDDLTWTQSAAAAAMSGFSLGAFASALATERLLRRFTARSVLLVSSIASLGALALFISASSTSVVVTALFLLGAAAAPHHPLTQAAAYDLVPGKPGVVNALAQAFVVFDVVMPLVLGVIASHYGVTRALAALALQPLIVLAVAGSWPRIRISRDG